ncbi:MAG: hypothetical protein R2697_17545 [Ilumatobacteraceae bacterium]
MTLDPASSVDLDQAFAIEVSGRDIVLHCDRRRRLVRPPRRPARP